MLLDICSYAVMLLSYVGSLSRCETHLPCESTSHSLNHKVTFVVAWNHICIVIIMLPELLSIMPELEVGEGLWFMSIMEASMVDVRRMWEWL